LPGREFHPLEAPGFAWRTEELAQFWDTHDLTDFEDELAEVTEPVFEHITAVKIHLQPQQIEAVKEIANTKGLGAEESSLGRRCTCVAVWRRDEQFHSAASWLPRHIATWITLLELSHNHLAGDERRVRKQPSEE
jgi:hypothetical protein